MAFRFNPFTGEFDVTGGSTPRWAFNPFTGKLDRDSNTGGYVFNPFTGNLDNIASVSSSANNITWSTDVLEWGATNSISWG